MDNKKRDLFIGFLINATAVISSFIFAYQMGRTTFLIVLLGSLTFLNLVFFITIKVRNSRDGRARGLSD